VTAPQLVINLPGTSFNSRASASVDFIDYFPSTKLIYLTAGANKAVEIIDTATNKHAGRIPLADVPHQFILDPALNLAAVSLSNRTVSVIDMATGDLKSIEIGGSGITDLGGLDPANHIVAFGSKTAPMVSFIKLDPAGSELLSQMPFPGDSPEAVPFNPATGLFYVLLRNSIVLIDPLTQEVVDTWEFPGCTPHNFVLGPNNEAFVGCTTGERIINMETGAIVTQIEPAQIGGSDQVAYNPTTQQYVATGSANRNGVTTRLLAWIDANTHQIVKNIEIDPGSYNQVAVDPTSGLAYVATQPAVGGACLSACIFVYSPNS